MEIQWKILFLFLQICLVFSKAPNRRTGCSFEMNNPEFHSDQACDKDLHCKIYINSETTYDGNMSKCIIPLHKGYCNQTSKFESCPSNSVCDPQYNECGCSKMFRANALEMEVSPYSVKCEPTKMFMENCNLDENILVCNRNHARLECRSGKCQCRPGQIWNQVNSKCVAEKCEDRISSAFLDHQTKECTMRLSHHGNPYRKPKFNYHIDNIKENLITCPRNSTFISKNDIGGCYCDENFEPNGNITACVKVLNHEERCEGNNSCNSWKGLICNKSSGKCSCRLEAQAVWNSELELCFSHKDCQDRYNIGSFYNTEENTCSTGIGYSCEISNSGSNSKEPKCPMNSECKTGYVDVFEPKELICVCQAPYVSSNDGTKCLRKKTYAETCTTHDDCFKSAGLSCWLDGKCRCSRKDRIWENGTCKVLVGHFCSADSDCSSHSSCEFKNKNKNGGLCSCQEGYGVVKKSGFGVCFGYPQSECLVDEDCHKGLTCIDGTCKCQDPFAATATMNHDSMCVRSAGSVCFNDSSSACTSNSECMNGICKCISGYIQTDNGKCALGYGQKCTAGKCDFSKGLACISSNCSCIGSSMTFSSEKGCTTSLGQKCGFIEPVGNCTSAGCDFYKVACEDSLSCKFIDFRRSVSRCQI